MFRWDETEFDELRLNNIFGNGCLNIICPIQAINAIDTEQYLLITLLNLKQFFVNSLGSLNVN